MSILANLERHFLPWDRPLLPQAAAWLARGWRGEGPLDLKSMMVIVPTRQSGRRLREALAEHASLFDSAVLAPRVALPEDLLTPVDGMTIASRLEAQLAWTEVLQTAQLAEFRAVFPVDPPMQDFGWASRVATQLQHLQAAAAEIGLRLRDVSPRAGVDFPEAERWMQLGQLEGRCDARLAAVGRREPQVARIESARKPALPSGITRIVLLACPDPLPLAIAALEEIVRHLPVDVVVFGPEEKNYFDKWGRPLETVWSRRPFSSVNFDAQVHLCGDAADQAAWVTRLARRYEQPERSLSIGVADAEVAPALETALRTAGRAVFNPAGRPRKRDELHALLVSLASLVREANFDTAQSLVRCPDFIAWLATRVGEKFSCAAMLQELDELNELHLPTTITAALRHTTRRLAARAALEALLEIRTQLTTGEFPGNAARALETIFAGRREAGNSPLAESAQAWMEVLREAQVARSFFSDVTLTEWWELTLAHFAESRFESRKEPGSVDLLGWLELLWEDAPHLVVTGLNDGRVPEAITGDPFLPEALRSRLGLKTNEERFARDAYLLAAVAECRKLTGRLDMLVGKVSAAGDPLRPSRLLMTCPDLELPRRVAALFRPVNTLRPALPWRRAWRLAPPIRDAPRRVSVTAFRDYLRCPFRFYLKHALNMESVDPTKSEMDALDFGTLCHAALESMGNDVRMRECTDAALLREFLLAEVNRRAREQFGSELTLPLIVQLESARQRLARVAQIQAQERAAGWVIEHVERKFELALGAVTVSGKIDRIERNIDSGAVRVIDYKTADRGIPPLTAHVRPARREETAPVWARFAIEGKELVWTDLQLPLYLLALAGGFGVAPTAGYFNLPKAIGETGFKFWDGYDSTWQMAAMRCAEGVAAGVSAGRFWPPAELSPREEDDAFAGLFHQGTAESVEWRGKP